jgi:glucose-6-phosphate isomerase
MLNTANITRERLGTQGLEWDALLTDRAAQYTAARDAILSRADDEAAMLGWLGLPEDTAALEAAQAVAGEFAGRFDDLVVLGIGGSSLGGLSVITALQHPYRALQGASGEGMRVHFVENVDGDAIAGLLEVLDPQRTLVNVISKSGTTTETMSAYLICKAWLEGVLGEAWTKQVIATTDPKKGVLRPMVAQYGFPSLSVPPSVGGRYSVLSAVGTLPALLAGVDALGLMRGAAKANAEFKSGTLETNAAMQFALANVEYCAKGKNIVVLMPYSTRARFVSDWFAQLWAESLGKIHPNGSHTGTTPVKAVGATDQHSVVQLFMEGPNDKLIVFVRFEHASRDTRIPNSEPTQPDMNYLGGKSFQTLLNAEQAATANALRTMEKPNVTFSLERLDAENLGWLMQTLMLATAVTGEVWGIDTFNQPGVELGKKFTYALMGRPGYEDERQRLEGEGVKG